METVRDALELIVVVDQTYDQNCYVLHRRDTDDALVVDPGLQNQSTLRLLEERGWQCGRILLTHGHGDHVNGVPAIVAAHHCSVAMHPDDREQLATMRYLPGIPDDVPDVHVDHDLAGGQVIGWHAVEVTVIHTPGHTRGSVCFLLGTDLLSGDTLFRRGVGRADLPGGDWHALVSSVEHSLYSLAPEVAVYPGHGQSTTIGEEMRSNPFVVHPRWR